MLAPLCGTDVTPATQFLPTWSIRSNDSLSRVTICWWFVNTPCSGRHGGGPSWASIFSGGGGGGGGLGALEELWNSKVKMFEWATIGKKFWFICVSLGYCACPAQFIFLFLPLRYFQLSFFHSFSSQHCLFFSSFRCATFILLFILI